MVAVDSAGADSEEVEVEAFNTEPISVKLRVKPPCPEMDQRLLLSTRNE